MNALLRNCFLAGLALLAVSCTEDELGRDRPSGGGREAMVTLRLKAAPEMPGTPGQPEKFEMSGTPETRAFNEGDVNEGTASDYQIADFWLLQYTDKGNLIGAPRYFTQESFQGENGNETTVPIILPDEGVTYKCVIIANTHSEGFGTTLINQTTLEKLKALPVPVNSQSDLVIGTEDHSCLMMNSVVDVTSDMTTLDCQLYRNVAKLTLKLTNKEGSGVKITSVRFRSVPNKMFIADQLYQEDPSPSPTPKQTGFIAMKADECVINPGEASKELVYYLPRNMRGNVQGSDPSGKNNIAPDYATLLEIMAEDATAGTPLRYRFYLGKDMTGDFNIEPNYHYTLPITISDKGDAENDPRVEDLGRIILGDANSHIINPNDGTAQSIFCLPITRADQFWDATNGTRPLRDGEWVAEVIWQDQSKRLIKFCDDNGNTAKPNQFDGKGDECFHFIPELGAKGNVLVGIRKKDADPKDDGYLWSWHLWITDYNPNYRSAWQEDVYAYPVDGGNVHRYAAKGNNSIWDTEDNLYIMDRNLGASGANILDDAGGLYYQFGRKDPFPSAAIQLYDIEGNKIPSLIETGGGASLIYVSVQRPFIFYTSSGDWLVDNPYDGYIWNNPEWNQAIESTGKSLFDPCPRGWKLPDNTTWEIFADNKNPISTNWGDGYRFYMSGDKSIGKTAYYPAAGRRKNNDGTMADQGGRGYVWSMTSNGNTHGYNFWFGQGNGQTNVKSAVPRANGYPVRCIRCREEL